MIFSYFLALNYGFVLVVCMAIVFLLHLFVELLSLQIITASRHTGVFHGVPWFQELVLLSPWAMEGQNQLQHEDEEFENHAHEITDNDNEMEDEDEVQDEQGSKDTKLTFDEDVQLSQLLYLALRESKPYLPSWSMLQAKKVRELGRIRVGFMVLEAVLFICVCSLIDI